VGVPVEIFTHIGNPLLQEWLIKDRLGSNGRKKKCVHHFGGEISYTVSNLKEAAGDGRII
jgi:hypothetical protein